MEVGEAGADEVLGFVVSVHPSHRVVALRDARSRIQSVDLLVFGHRDRDRWIDLEPRHTLGGLRDKGAVALLAAAHVFDRQLQEPALLAQRILAALPFDRHCHLRRDEREDVELALSVTHTCRIRLRGDDADRAVLDGEGHAHPIDGRRTDQLRLAGGDQLFMDLRCREQRSSGPEHVLGQSLAKLAGRNVPRRVVFVHEVGKFELVALLVVQRNVEVLGRHQLADDLVDGAQQFLEVVRRVGRVRYAIHRLLHAFRPAACGDVAEAPDAAHGVRIDPQRNRIALEDPAVLERQDVGAFGVRRGVQLANLLDKLLRVDELLLHMPNQLAVVLRGDQVGRDAPHLFEAAIVRYHATIQIDNQDAVRRGFERRLEN